MGHLAIVDENTVKEIFRTGVVQIKARLGKQCFKSAADIFADVLSVRPNDPIYPWITSCSSSLSPSFTHKFVASGKAWLNKGDPFPIKIPVYETYFEANNPLTEAAALDLFSPPLLWNAIGKKSLGRGRSFNHQTVEEDRRLDELLALRPGKDTISRDQTRTVSSWEISIDQSAPYRNSRPISSLADFEPHGFGWRHKCFFKYEKALEAWFVENIDKDSCHWFWRFFSPGKIEWFGNYLPFGLQGSNIDLVVVRELESKTTEVYVIELKVGPLNLSEWQDASKQASEYASFIQKAFNSFGKDFFVRPIVLAGPKKRGFPSVAIDGTWISYKIEEGQVRFSKIS